MGTVTKPNRLTQEQTFAFLKALENKDNQEYITQHRMSQKQAAAYLSKELGFEVTGNQVEQAARTVKFQLPREVSASKQQNEVLKAQVLDLQNKVISLMQTVEVMRRDLQQRVAEYTYNNSLILYLYKELNQKVPTRPVS